MHRPDPQVLSGLLSLTLLLSTSVSQAVTPVPQSRIEAPRPPVEINYTGLELGIRSYGIGAVSLVSDSLLSKGETWQDLSGGEPSSLLAVTRKLSGTPMVGSVTAFRVSPDGTMVVFIADKETLSRFELYSVPTNGSAAPIKISAGLAFGAGDIGVRSFQISPDSAKVVFLADANTGGGLDEIFSAPINGSAAAVRLNAGAVAPVTGFGITPDSARAIFFGVDTSFASGAVEAYSSLIGTASSAVQVSDVGQGNALGDVVSAEFSPDSSRVIYAGDGSVDGVFQWYSVPAAAVGPGTDVPLSASLGTVGLVRISPDSSRVVYTSDENVLGRMEVFSRPIGGGTRIQLNPAMAGDGVTSIAISPDGNRLGYLADQISAGVNEVFSAQMLVAGSGARLNTPMSGAQYADTMNISPDGTTVVYEADQTTPGTYELYRVPLAGGAAPSTLHVMTPPSSAGYFEGLGTPILGRRAVYPVFGATVDLFSVPFDGSAPFEQVNDPLAAGQSLFSVFLPSAATRLMAYGFGSSSGTATSRIVAAPVRSDLPTEQVNVTAAAGAKGVLGYEISSDEQYAVYLQDQDTVNKTELYSRELDSDADTVVNGADNCPFVANSSQGGAVFPATVVATNLTTFSWATPMDVRFVRGPVGSVASYATNLTGTLVEAASYTEPGTPDAGTGWYYLFAPDCAGRSYQSAPGAQPARDLAAFP